MNAISTALQEAGVTLPSIYQRIWRYFKDHPRSTSLACTQVLKLSRAHVSSYISEMETRRMLRSEQLELRVKGARGVFHARKVKHYSVNINEFEMLPKPHRAASAARKSVKKPVPKPAPAPTVATPALPADWDAEALVRALTPRQARAVYDHLKEIFA